MSSYRSQFDLVSLLSNEPVFSQFSKEQDKSSKESPITSLGTMGERVVHVYSINFIDNLVLNEKALPKDHQNLAEVVFTLTDIDKSTGHKLEKNYNAIISWQYTAPSSSP